VAARAQSTSGAALRTVAHVVQNLDVGGLERVVISLMRSTDPARYHSILYTLGGGGVLSTGLAQAGFRVRSFTKAPGLDYALLVRMARMLRADRVDIVHCHNYSPLVYGAISGRAARVAGVVYTAHGAKTSGRRATRTFQRLRLVDEVVFVSDDARRVALAAGAVRDRRVHTIVNGVDTRAYARGSDVRRRVRAEFSMPDDAPVVGIIARLTPAKDHVNLFDAFRRVRDAHADARLLLVGDGELRAELERAVHERGLASAVVFAGRRDDVADVLSALDIFVLSSATEGLAVTLLEAMAAGLPVVATRVGGNPEVVVDGDTGRLVPPRDPEALAAAIGELLTDRARAARMGERGAERARGRFGIDAMVNSYLALYDALAARRARWQPEVNTR
jgi:sugar transferase (PEP-CTERM/EpsH1 system associated)